MLELHIKTKSELLKLLQGSDIKLVVAKDVDSVEDLKDAMKSGESMLRTKKHLTLFLVAN